MEGHGEISSVLAGMRLRNWVSDCLPFCLTGGPIIGRNGPIRFSGSNATDWDIFGDIQAGVVGRRGKVEGGRSDFGLY